MCPHIYVTVLPRKQPHTHTSFRVTVLFFFLHITLLLIWFGMISIVFQVFQHLSTYFIIICSFSSGSGRYGWDRTCWMWKSNLNCRWGWAGEWLNYTRSYLVCQIPVTLQHLYHIRYYSLLLALAPNQNLPLSLLLSMYIRNLCYLF